MMNGATTDVKRFRDEKLAEARQLVNAYGWREMPQATAEYVDELIAQAQTARSPFSTPAYRNAFWKEMAGAELTGSEKRALLIGSDTAGGYVAPDEPATAVRQTRDELVLLRQFATVEPLARTMRGIPVCDSVGSASWLAETEAVPEDDPSFSMRMFRGKRLARLIKVGHELVDDGGALLEAAIIRAAARAFATAEDSAFLTGDGVKGPTGILTSGTTAVTATGTTSVTEDELRQTKHALPTPYQKTARWFLHPDTLEAVAKLKDGAGRNLDLVRWVNNEPYLLDAPASISTNMPQMTSAQKAVAFADPTYYHILERAAMSIQYLRELYATQGQAGYLATEFCDGKLLVAEACQILVMA